MNLTCPIELTIIQQVIGQLLQAVLCLGEKWPRGFAVGPPLIHNLRHHLRGLEEQILLEVALIVPGGWQQGAEQLAHRVPDHGAVAVPRRPAGTQLTQAAKVL